MASTRMWILDCQRLKDDKYAVTLFPVEKCSCSALGNCYQIQAAKMSNGQIEDSGKQILNMSRIRSASKKRRNKHAGNKKPRPIDIYDDNQCQVNPHLTHLLTQHVMAIP